MTNLTDKILNTPDWAVYLILYGGVAIVSIAVLLVFSAHLGMNCSITPLKVTDKQAVSTGNGFTYLIYTPNEVFQDEDTWLKWKFNSSDVYNNLKVGKTYSTQVCGWRVPFLSWYRNIITLQ